jgi:hypothetical protein
MTTWAAVAATEAFISRGASPLPGSAPGTIHAFAAGALLTAACFVVIVTAWRLWRSRLSAREGMWGGGMRRARFRRDYAAEDAEAIVAPADADSYLIPAGGHPYADEADADVILPGTAGDQLTHDQTGRGSHRSKHRMTGSDNDHRPDAPRTAPRHAAPSPGLGSRMSGRFAASPLISRG